MNCNIIKDLLPLYCDRQASTESSEVIEKHLNDCPDCRRYFEMMVEETICKEAADARKNRDISEVFHKFHSRVTRKMSIAVLLTAVCCTFIFLWFFWGVVPANSKDVKITPSASTYYNEDMDCMLYSVDFELELKTGKCIDARYERNEDPNIEVYTVYSQYKIPFDDRGKHPERFTTGFSTPEPFTDDNIIQFRFKDKTISYNLKELAETYEIQ